MEGMARDAVVLDAAGRPVGAARDEGGGVQVEEKFVFQDLPFPERYAVSRFIVEQKRAHPDLPVKDENMAAACDVVVRAHEKYGDHDLDRIFAAGAAGLAERGVLTVHGVQNGLASVTLDLRKLCSLDIVPGLALA